MPGATVNGTETDPVLATENVSSGTTFSVAIPDSADAESVTSATTGTMNINTVVVSTSGTSQSYTTVAASTASPGTADVGTLPAYDPTLTSGYTQATGQAIQVSPYTTAPPPCVWKTISRVNQIQTRIGEMHVAGGTGITVKATYLYEQNADSSFSVGVSGDDENWSASGNIEITNSSDTTATVTNGPNFVRYLDADFDYGQQKAGYVLSCGNLYRQLPLVWDGDAYNGPNTPPTNPWGGCLSDPNGYARLDGNSTWSHYTSTGVQYGMVANIWAFAFSGHTGYTTTNGFKYVNPAGGGTVYLCSTTSPVGNWHLIYNNPQ